MLSPSSGEAPGGAAPHDVVPVNGNEVLEKLVALPISTWSYVGDPAGARHLGPMAQDFATAFGLGADNRVINLLDANGVVMVAIQGLYRRLEALETDVAALRQGHGDAQGS